MQAMHVGDRWEIYVPAELGYGKYSQPGIPEDRRWSSTLSSSL